MAFYTIITLLYGLNLIVLKEDNLSKSVRKFRGHVTYDGLILMHNDIIYI